MDKVSHCMPGVRNDRQHNRIYNFNLNLISYAMKKNMGTIDKVIRVIVAIVIGVLYFTGQITGTAAIILGILAVVFLLTSIVGTCPLYLPVGLSTKKD